jgi:excinuclease UvrABC nuclease subunit
MPIQDLKTRIARLPEQPGVYLYFNERGDTIYVGKRALRDQFAVTSGRAAATRKRRLLDGRIDSK